MSHRHDPFQKRGPDAQHARCVHGTLVRAVCFACPSGYATAKAEIDWRARAEAAEARVATLEENYDRDIGRAIRETKEKLALALEALRTTREDLGRAAYVNWQDGSSGDGQLSAMCRALDAAIAKLEGSAGE